MIRGRLAYTHEIALEVGRSQDILVDRGGKETRSRRIGKVAGAEIIMEIFGLGAPSLREHPFEPAPECAPQRVSENQPVPAPTKPLVPD
jgi:hypothetical protein